MTGRRKLTSFVAAVAAMSALGGLAVAPAEAKDLKFALSIGWTEGESGQHLLRGFKDSVAELGGTLTVADAAYDAKRQADQIDAFIKSKPDALFVTASDPAAISPAVKRAVDAGIPVFAADSLIPGVAVTSTAISNNFGMGEAAATYIAKKLDGKGNVAMVNLPANETWDERSQGFKYALKQYPDIKIVGTWDYNSTGTTTPRQGVEGLLNANPNIDAIWSAWDGAAMEGALAVRASGRKIFTTGIDGGKQPFNFIKSGGAMTMTIAQNFYEMAYLDVHNAVDYLNGQKVPRLVVTPSFEVTTETLKPLTSIPDDYDHPGKADQMGWKRL